MRRRLDAAELADAAITAALVIGLLTFGRLLAAATLFQVLGTVVFAVLAARRRVRAVAVATAASMAMAVLLGGLGPISQAFVAGLFGGCGGWALQRGFGLVRAVLLSVLVAWPVVSAFTLGFLALFQEARELSFENGRNQWQGTARILESVGLDGVATGGTEVVDWSIEHWWLMVPLLQLAISVGYALLVRRLGGAVLRRVDASLGEPWRPVPRDDATPMPVPVHICDPTIERTGSTQHLPGLDELLAPGERVVLTGPNGAGKTTLMEGLAGLLPTEGIERRGAPALGEIGGTALIRQAPDTQVVGLRVIDDLRWGLADRDPAELRAHLAAVGLEGRDTQPTSQLSGGELQRLAVAAALARRPRLLLSDEATAMLDHDGRSAVVGLLTGAGEDMTVLHSTHHHDETGGFDRVVDLPADPTPRPGWTPARGGGGPPALRVCEVGFVHDAGSPWARRALTGVSFELRPGELAVVQGPNGSGKTTLVRLLAGLRAPTEGEVLLHGRPVDGPDPRIGVAFQHARLQLLRPTVAQEVRALLGTRDARSVADVLTTAGLDTTVDGRRRVAELSGGQQRRLLVAALAARQVDLLVLDEPLAGLDAPSQAALTAVIDRLLGTGTMVVVVSHDPEWALERADTVIRLSAEAEVGS